MVAFGLRPQIERMADRLASEGYAVLAPNVFYRDHEAASRARSDFGVLREYMKALTPDAVERDARAYLDFLAARRVADAGRRHRLLHGRAARRC